MKYGKLFQLKGNAVVVGGAGGFGQACAQALAEQGCSVLIGSRKEENLVRAREEIREASGIQVEYAVCDAALEEDVCRLAKTALERFGQVDYLINAQGFNRKHDLSAFSTDDWDQMFAVNVRSIMLTLKYFGPSMKAAGYGKIVNYSSVRGIRGSGGGNAGYCATKGAVDMLTRCSAVELGPEVRVNAVGPMITYTPMMEGILPEDPEVRNHMADDKPLKRIGLVEDCVGPTLFLLAPASDFMTGQIIYPDGGLTAIG